jgi:hypothetical protein
MRHKIHPANGVEKWSDKVFTVYANPERELACRTAPSPSGSGITNILDRDRDRNGLAGCSADILCGGDDDQRSRAEERATT